jgi:hypothetical protein
MTDRRAYKRLWRAARKAAGICMNCPAPATHGVFCERHAAENLERTRKLQQAHVEAGLCRYCTQRAIRGKMCEGCFAKYATWSNPGVISETA